MFNIKRCPICKEPTAINLFGNYNKFDLCKKHAKMQKRNEIIKCINCDNWHQINDICECQKLTCFFCGKPTNGKHFCMSCSNKYKDKSIAFKLENLKCKKLNLECLFCGKLTNGKHFCIDCWNKYINKSIDIRFKNLKYEKITDYYGNKDIPCKNGIKVRSKAEKIICDYLFDHNIKFIYEAEISYNEYGKEKIFKPDFFLPSYSKTGLIIEYNELKEQDYVKRKNYTQSIYIKLGIEVLVLTKKDLDDNLQRLKSKLNIII